MFYVAFGETNKSNLCNGLSKDHVAIFQQLKHSKQMSSHVLVSIRVDLVSLSSIKKPQNQDQIVKNRWINRWKLSVKVNVPQMTTYRLTSLLIDR